MLNKIAVTCLLSLTTLPVFADDDVRVEYRIGMSEAQFEQANTEFFGQGLRLVDMTVAEVSGKPVVGAIWQRYPQMPAPTPERTQSQLKRVFLKLDEAGLKGKNAQLGEQGSAVEVIDAYVVDGKNWFAASFAPPREPSMQKVGLFLDGDAFGAMRERAQAANHDLVRIDTYFQGDEMMALPVFVGREPAELDAGVFENTLSIDAKGVSMYLKDMHPMSISRCESGGQSLWFATWDKGPDRDFVFTDRGEKIRELVAAGGTVVDLDSEAESGEVFYYAVVQKKD